MTHPSAEQLQIIGAPIAPMSVVACAGSGKTFTAVHRLAQMRRELGVHRGRVALVSFSNIAVDTFRREYQNLVQGSTSGAAHNRVEIDTLDGFITGNVLRPHANRTMGCGCTPYLVIGTEQFLQNRDYRFWAEPVGRAAFPVGPNDLHKVVVNMQEGRPTFHLRHHSALIPINNGQLVTSRLGALGAYTHDLGRYWCLRTLTSQPNILRALVRRYPHILIDEAQDIGTMHQAIIELLLDAGCQVSLIGDPNQGIYEFAGADGSFLSQYGQRAGVRSLALTRNFRSVPAILELANRISTRADTADRAAPATTHGAFFIPYRDTARNNLIAAFEAAIAAADLKFERSAVLCRGRDLADQLAGNQEGPGQGLVRNFAKAAILRDHKRDFLRAHKLVTTSIVGLLANPPQGLVARITQPAGNPKDRAMCRLIWEFTRNSGSGLPAATLSGETHWHPQLLARIKALLATIRQDHGLACVENLGNKLAKRGLTNAPLFAAGNDLPRIRVDTVHQAKGESLDAVLYLANRDQVNALIAGVNTELGRIGYVALSRARNLFWLGLPANALEELRPELLARGFQEALTPGDPGGSLAHTP